MNEYLCYTRKEMDSLRVQELIVDRDDRNNFKYYKRNQLELYYLENGNIFIRYYYIISKANLFLI